jgi:ATP citrate (pro-S)-lyase
MSNELNNIISKATNGVLEGVAIGGDRYPGTNFMDHIMRYQANPKVFGRSFLWNVRAD